MCSYMKIFMNSSAPPNANDVSYVTKALNHDSHLVWQAQYIAIFGDVAPRNVNDVSYVTRISHESHSTWQA